MSYFGILIDRTCSTVSIKNGRVSLQTDNNKQIALYRCSAGYNLNGPIQRQCHDGQWTGMAPTCE